MNTLLPNPGRGYERFVYSPISGCNASTCNFGLCEHKIANCAPKSHTVHQQTEIVRCHSNNVTCNSLLYGEKNLEIMVSFPLAFTGINCILMQNNTMYAFIYVLKIITKYVLI
jgi:hypothetical protein